MQLGAAMALFLRWSFEVIAVSSTIKIGLVEAVFGGGNRRFWEVIEKMTQKMSQKIFTDGLRKCVDFAIKKHRARVGENGYELTTLVLGGTVPKGLFRVLNSLS